MKQVSDATHGLDLSSTPSAREKSYSQPTNRGVESGRVGGSSSKIDYLSARLEYPKSLNDERFGGLPLPNDIFRVKREIRGSGYYRRGVELHPAGRLFWTDNQRDIGSFVIFAGDELDELRAAAGWSDFTMLERLKPRMINATRLDFAVDIRAGHPSECVAAFQNGEVQTRIKNVRQIAEIRPDKTTDDSASGFTAYFGSPTSHKILRVYDKAAELKLLHEVLTRVELQTRKKSADTLCNLMLAEGVQRAGKAAIRGHIMFPELEWYTEAMNAELEAHSLYSARQSDFEKWLEQVVGPALDNRAADAKYSPKIRTWLTERLAALDEQEATRGGDKSEPKTGEA